MLEPDGRGEDPRDEPAPSHSTPANRVIHPTAIIHPGARLHPSVIVEAFAVVDEHVSLGADCVVGPRVCLTGHTTIGARNRFSAGAVIGDTPQDLKYKDAPSRVRIGDDNEFRERVTVHRATTADAETVIGSHNVFMVGAHVGHNARVGNHVVLVNGTMLGGHAEVQDGVHLSGGCGVHQFVRVGTLSMGQCGAIVTQDLPPFTLAKNGINLLCGLNTEGLRRAGVSSAERMELRRLYGVLFRGRATRQDALREASERFTGARARQMIDFVASSKRGVCSDPGAQRSGGGKSGQ